MERSTAPATDPAIDAAIAEVEGEFGVLFQRIRRRWKELAQSIHPELQPVAYKVLSTLVSEGPMPATRLAEQLEVDKSVLSRQFTLLERLGLVERRTDKHDRRIRLIAPTPTAVERVAAVRVVTQAEFQAELKSWSPDEVVAFSRMLKRLSSLA